MIPQNISREHVLEAIKEIKRIRVPYRRESTKFYLFYDGERFAPKYVISLANKFANGLELEPSQFSGGYETNSFLRKLGFEIVEKSKQKSSSLGMREIRSLVKKIQNEYIPKKRIEARKKYEDQAIEIATKSLGKLTKEHVGKTVELLDTDLWKGRTIRRRFGLLLWGKNQNLILANDEKKMNLLFLEVFDKENLDNVEGLVSDLKGIGDGFVSCLLYLKNREKYNVFVKATSKGVKAVFPEEPDFHGPFKDRYVRFNRLANELKKECDLEPQEMDIVLTSLPSWIGEAKEEEAVEEMPLRRWWVEKTIVKGRSDRETGDYSLGKALWSPQSKTGGGDIYKSMREIKKGDAVLHFIDNARIVGISIVDKECDPTFFCLAGTAWDDGTGKRPGYLVTLKDLEKLETHVDRSDILNERYKDRLLSLLEEGHWLFYNKKLELNQGAYLTEAPRQLIEIVNEVYKGKTGENLPFWSGPIGIGLSLDQLSIDTFLPKDILLEWERLLEEKKQIILYGPPGTGKTFVAKKFADYFVRNGGKTELVQFHPSYSYEDFVEGIKPKIITGVSQIYYEIADGILKRLCREANKNPDKKFVVLIDEINRGNIPKIFGELIHCLEYRGEKHRVLLPYSQEYFFMPKNLYVLGTMNSADRSIALVDYALRRRFNFIDFMPEEQILAEWFEQNPPLVDKNKVIELLRKINLRIREDEKLGKHFQIGHSYFMHEKLDEKRLREIWKYNLMPLLEEYYFEDEEAIKGLQRIFKELFAPSENSSI